VILLNLNIRGRLILGFSVLCALLAVVVGTTIVKVGAVNESTDRTVNLRVPTAMTASDVVAGVYASLASLRGWLITGNDTFKAERATTISEMNEIASAIASAVEEQGSATQEIARNVQQAALGTGEISANVVGVQQAAGDTGSAAHQVLQASSELSKQSETMRGEVEAFLSNIKAA
jgi:CHASE3 domain sensor protein